MHRLGLGEHGADRTLRPWRYVDRITHSHVHMHV